MSGSLRIGGRIGRSTEDWREDKAGGLAGALRIGDGLAGALRIGYGLAGALRIAGRIGRSTEDCREDRQEH